MQFKVQTEYRTHTCSQLRRVDVGNAASLSGWLRNRRNHGGVLFLELADHYGVTQIVVNPSHPAFDQIAHFHKETVLQVHGQVVARNEENLNTRLPTGEIELVLEQFEVLGHAEPTPFPIYPESPAPEDQRLKYRFLDLRRPKMHRNIELRSNIIASIRNRMTSLGFSELQTPTLTSSSPEGARDFLVPSRRHPGKFYALPQAPQQFKQLFMASGFDRYFQIAPCYRDEDARADRSPGEFYQLDLEMSFVSQEDVFAVVEDVMTGLFKEFRPDAEITAAPFTRLTYAESMLRFGSDKPDLRNPLEITDLTDLFVTSALRTFAGKTVRCIAVPGMAQKTRSFFDKLEEFAKGHGAPGLAWVLLEPGGVKGPIAKFLDADQLAKIAERTGAAPGHALFFSADTKPDAVRRVLAPLRDELARQLDLLPANTFRFCWIVDFPMYELNEDTQAIEFSHNPFSMPQGGLKALETLDPLEIKAFQYDVVCNGYELSSGAIRNHRLEVMYKAFQIAGYPPEVVDQKFGALAQAFRYGAPPHGGIAPGIDRIVMLIADEPNIREVTAFPMNQGAEDLMMGAPSTVRPEQLRELHITVQAKK